ncbi:hypothetical protein C4572_03735 [Candidatus Parcubacteria bacterium]|nr:MAG: hypothetical protein C4572_03735 [Candidatus Parcubacteria bacterium]
MIEVKKKESETTAGLMRRFSQRVKLSGNLSKVRSHRFKTRPKSELKKKEDALKREAYRKKTELLRKLGKID